MTILVGGHIRIGEGEVERLRPLLAEHMRTVAAEAGCELYSFAFDAADPSLIRVQERWASADALKAHGGQEHQRAFGRALRDFDVREIKVDAWEGEHWRTLIG